MKKCIALVLAMVIVLSLVSVVAMAEGPAFMSQDAGLYGFMQNGALSEKLEMGDGNSQYVFSVDLSTSSSKTVFFWHPEVTSLSSEAVNNAGSSVTIEKAAEDLEISPYRITVTGNGTVRVQLYPVFSGEGSGDGDNGGDNDGGDGGDGSGTEQHPLQPQEKFPGTLSDAYQLGEFTYNNEIYYLSPIVLRDAQSGMFGIANGSSNPPSAGQPWQYAVGFYRSTSDGYVLVDATTRAVLLEAFDSLSLSLLAMENPDSINYPNYATHYPAAQPWDGLGWPCGVTHIYTAETAGSWLYVADGEIGGGAVSAYAIFRYEPQKRVVAEDFNSIDDVNTWLEGFAEGNAGTGTSCTLVLPAGEFVGNIYVPEELELVTISGSTDDGGNNTTTIVGGVEAGSKVILLNLDFEGANANKSGWQHWERNWGDDWHEAWGRKVRAQWDAEWPANSNAALVGKENYAIWGDFPVLYDSCSFRGYYHAVHNSEVITFGGDHSLFEDNAVAIYFDTDGWAGNLTMTENIFKHNGSAFYFERFSDKHTMAEYQIIRCKFIDNPIEVINRGNRHFFLHGNYFKWGSNHGAVCAPSANVHAFPYATNEACTAFDYTAEDAVMLNNQTLQDEPVAIPAADLDGKTITLMDDKGEKAVAAWKFDE